MERSRRRLDTIIRWAVGERVPISKLITYYKGNLEGVEPCLTTSPTRTLPVWRIKSISSTFRAAAGSDFQPARERNRGRLSKPEVLGIRSGICEAEYVLGVISIDSASISGHIKFGSKSPELSSR
jgi:hypothetical protein